MQDSFSSVRLHLSPERSYNVTNKLIIEPVAHIRTDFTEKFGLPRQSGRVDELCGTIIFEPKYRNPDALREIEGFSHLWLIFDFSMSHRENSDTWQPTVRPPRLGGNRKVGVFASRSPFRPNPIGLSCVKLVGVEKTDTHGTVLKVSGVDLLDGTPILDIKPYLPFADSHPDAVGGYADEERSHHLKVNFPSNLLEKLPEVKRSAAVACIAEDPRPSYQSDSRVYTMSFAGYEIDFTVEDDTATVFEVRIL